LSRTSWMTPQEKLILVAVLAGLMLFIIYFELRVMRGRSKEIRQSSQRKDEAFNAILTTRHVINVVQRSGRNTRAAQSVLEEAKYSMQKGDYDNAVSLAEKARAELIRPPPPPEDTSGPARDLENMAEEVLSSPKSDKNLYSGTKLPVDQTGSYLSAQFELKGARDDIAKAVAMGKSVSAAEALMTEADAAFEQGNYTRVLSLAVRARRTVGMDGAIETIPLKSPEPSEIEEEPVHRAEAGQKRGECAKCGESVDKGDAFCAKCGARVIVDRTCENCGAKAKSADKFCRKCGGKIV
jgi:hypothetical protein